MKRQRLTLNDIAGDLLDSYEQRYQRILKDYKAQKAECSNYRDDIKKAKAPQLQRTYIKKVQDLRNEMHTKIKEIMEKKKAEFTAAWEEKNKPLDLEKEFPSMYGIKDLDSGNQIIKRNEAFRYLYRAIEKNSNLLTTNLLLKAGDDKAIGAFLEKNKDDNDLVNIIESNLKAAKNPKYNDLLNDISDSKVTMVDDLNTIASNLRFDELNNQMHTGIGFTRGHNFNKDFNVDDLVFETGDLTQQFFRTGKSEESQKGNNGGM